MSIHHATVLSPKGNPPKVFRRKEKDEQGNFGSEATKNRA
jgi:hypothetical protein